MGMRKRKTAEERQVALAAALKQDPGVQHGTRRAFIVSQFVEHSQTVAYAELSRM